MTAEEAWIERTRARIVRALERAGRGCNSLEEARARALRILTHAYNLGWMALPIQDQLRVSVDEIQIEPMASAAISFTPKERS